jgi:putative N6-adenine-specific DNA methylase
VAGELAALGIPPGPAEPGGVPFQGTPDDLARSNLWVRSASRVLVRLGRFHARALGELERRAGLLPWDRFLPAGTEVDLRVTSRKSRLYHHRAIAERVGRAIEGVTRRPPALTTEEGDEEAQAEGLRQLVVVRLLRDECLISLDSSGGLLHRRGYRLAAAKAPLRETLAAALLLASGWDGATPLLDPFCGAGTIAIEAIWLARRMAPGLHRRFAYEQWPELPSGLAGEHRRQAQQLVRPLAAPVWASDRDPGAIRAARENAGRAGVAGEIAFEARSFSALRAPPGPGSLVSNPPYGRRVGNPGDLTELYAGLGRWARRSLPGWTLTLMVPERPWERKTVLPFRELLRTVNGGTPVRVVGAECPP